MRKIIKANLIYILIISIAIFCELIFSYKFATASFDLTKYQQIYHDTTIANRKLESEIAKRTSLEYIKKKAIEIGLEEKSTQQ